MKLTNPTDNELNAAFAEKVAGLPVRDDVRMMAPMGKKVLCFSEEYGVCKEMPPFTRSFDTVLPWLEKWATVTIEISVDVRVLISETPSMMSCPPKENGWAIVQLGTPNAVARACVIALLRANGVEVEFTK